MCGTLVKHDYSLEKIYNARKEEGTSLNLEWDFKSSCAVVAINDYSGLSFYGSKKELTDLLAKLGLDISWFRGLLCVFSKDEGDNSASIPEGEEARAEEDASMPEDERPVLGDDASAAPSGD